VNASERARYGGRTALRRSATSVTPTTLASSILSTVLGLVLITVALRDVFDTLFHQ
jgi:hypothetical protein